MGKIEEHWCSICKKQLDKAKDQYVDFELVNMPKKGKLKAKKKKGLICNDCIEKDPELKKAFDFMVKAGNPTFLPLLECLQWQNCDTYQPVIGRPIRCAHMAVIGDKIYCKRSHPGTLELVQEESELIRLKQGLLVEYFGQLFNTEKMKELAKTDPVFAAGLELFKPESIVKLLDKTVYIPPSTVVEAKDSSD